MLRLPDIVPPVKEVSVVLSDPCFVINDVRLEALFSLTNLKLGRVLGLKK